MSVQTITRQALLKKMADVVNNLPDEKLQQVWKQLDTWEAGAAPRVNDNISHSSTDKQEVVEVVVAPRLGTQKQVIRLPIRSTGPVSKAIMEVGEATEDAPAFRQRLQANIEWWNQHFAKIRRDAALYDHYVAISDGEVFAGNSYQEAYQKARQVHPGGVPYIFFLKSPQEGTNHAN